MNRTLNDPSGTPPAERCQRRTSEYTDCGSSTPRNMGVGAVPRQRPNSATTRHRSGTCANPETFECTVNTGSPSGAGVTDAISALGHPHNPTTAATIHSPLIRPSSPSNLPHPTTRRFTMEWPPNRQVPDFEPEPAPAPVPPQIERSEIKVP